MSLYVNHIQPFQDGGQLLLSAEHYFETTYSVMYLNWTKYYTKGMKGRVRKWDGSVQPFKKGGYF